MDNSAVRLQVHSFRKKKTCNLQSVHKVVVSFCFGSKQTQTARFCVVYPVRTKNYFNSPSEQFDFTEKAASGQHNQF